MDIQTADVVDSSIAMYQKEKKKRKKEKRILTKNVVVEMGGTLNRFLAPVVKTHQAELWVPVPNFSITQETVRQIVAKTHEADVFVSVRVSCLHSRGNSDKNSKFSLMCFEHQFCKLFMTPKPHKTAASLTEMSPLYPLPEC